MKLFKNSLLLNEHPAFFDKHFCRYPVIRLNFKEVTASTLGNFYCTLARALHRTTARWLQCLKGVSLPAETLERYRRIPRACDDMEISFAEADQYWESQSSTADALFSWLSGLLREVYDSPYIVLFDEYDIPLKAIRRKAWGREAAETYTSLSSMIFKNNKDLKCGLLVGVYKMSLVDIGSGANCVHFLPLTVHGYCSGLNENGEQPCDLVEAFAYDETEVGLLVEAARQQYDLISKFSTESIMATLTRWYDGYTFGRTGGKFNPYAVAMFLRELKRSSNIDSATQDYWRDTGNQHTIQELVSDNWIEFTRLIRLIRRLTQDYDDSDKSKCSVFLTGQPSQAGEPSTRADAVGVSLGDESFPGHGGSGYTASHIVTLLIHTGYLTIGTGGAVRIPNGELRNMWERLWLLASFGTDDDEKQNTERRQLYGELFAGNVRGIFDSFQSAFTKLSNGANSYEEKALADILRSHVIGKLDHPRLLQKDGTISSASHSQQPDYVTEQESGYGKPDWVVKFPATKDRSQPFVIIVEFKRVTSKSRDSANGPLRLARAGLEQIIQKEYARPLDHYARRLDIGVAIGQGKVAMRQRLWTRVSGSPVEASNRKSNGMDPSISSTETVDEWDNRLVNANDAGWQDGLGWQTQRLEPSYRH
ncbi:hypothetical protein H4218_001823 [Coemansia sp. IMI 209128]|nr:hypothetical protein H4218_001823 [Coemansia sp. IMI 209128]